MVRMDWQPSPDGLRQILQLLKVSINHGPIGRDRALPHSVLTNETTHLVNSVQMRAVALILSCIDYFLTNERIESGGTGQS